MSERNYFDDLADRLAAIDGVGVEYGIADVAHPSGMSAAELGSILYYGTKDGRIPARDYLEDAEREVKMRSPVFFGRVLADAYAGHSPVRDLEDLADVAQQDGNATTTITNVAGPFTYLWSNGQTTANASGLAAGTYTVTVTTTPNCTGTASVTITQPLVIALAAIVTSATCGDANGSIQMQTVGGTPPYSFSWNTVPIQTTSVISSLLPGNFTCIVTDANGCTKSKAGIVVNVGNPITAAGVSVKRPCYQTSNGKVTVNSVTGGLAPYKYLWSNGTTLNSISNHAPGIYTVTITDSLGCSYVVAKTVTQRSQINANIAITNPGCGLCNGVAVATVTGGLKPYTYSWNTTPVQTDSAAVKARTVRRDGVRRVPRTVRSSVRS